MWLMKQPILSGVCVADYTVRYVDWIGNQLSSDPTVSYRYQISPEILQLYNNPTD